MKGRSRFSRQYSMNSLVPSRFGSSAYQASSVPPRPLVLGPTPYEPVIAAHESCRRAQREGIGNASGRAASRTSRRKKKKKNPRGAGGPRRCPPRRCRRRAAAEVLDELVEVPEVHSTVPRLFADRSLFMRVVSAELRSPSGAVNLTMTPRPGR